MNLAQIKLLITIITGLSAAIIGYLIMPKDIKQFQEKIESQKGKKSGILLFISPLLITIGEFILSLESISLNNYLKKIKSLLISASKSDTLSSDEFAALQIIIPLPVIPVFILSIYRFEMLAILKPPFIFALSITIFYFCLLLIPLIILSDLVKKRHKSISRELPFILDMITSSVHAGLDFSGAIRRILQKSTKNTPLQDELNTMLKEISLGKTRKEALQSLSLRVNLTDLTSVVNALIQADQLGTSVGAVLTTLSDDLRVKRFQRAEKQALEAPVKMLFPLIAFIFPAVFIILIGPLILQIIQSLGK